MIDPTFNSVDRLFVLSFENEDDKKSFLKYYTQKVEIKDVNVLIEGKSFLWCVSKKQRRIIEKKYWIEGK